MVTEGHGQSVDSSQSHNIVLDLYCQEPQASLELFSNAPSFITTSGGILIVFKLLQNTKAPSPINLTLSGIYILFSV